jgi:hypothetical protein
MEVQIMLSTINPYSFVEQDFIWIGEYVDGTHLSEYNIHTKEREDFYSIKRDALIRFGLIGHGMKLLYEVGGGFFKLNGQMYEFVYKVGDKEYYLTGQFKPYNDVITYKDAEAWANLTANDAANFPSRILAYNFGYKHNMTIDGVNFSLRALCSIPHGEPVHFAVRLVADQKLEGKLVIKKNGTEIAEFNAPLDKGVGGELKWAVI